MLVTGMLFPLMTSTNACNFILMSVVVTAVVLVPVVCQPAKKQRRRL